MSLFLSLEDHGHRVVISPQGGHCARPEINERIDSGRDIYGTTWRPIRPTVVYIGEVAIGLSVYELSEEVEMRWIKNKLVRASEVPASRGKNPAPIPDWSVTKRYFPSGKFCVRASSPYQLATWVSRLGRTDPAWFGRTDRVIGERRRSDSS